MTASPGAGEQQLQACLERADPDNGAELPEAARAANEARGLARELQRPDVVAQAGAWLARHLFNQGLAREAFAEAEATLAALGPQPPVPLLVDVLRIVAVSASDLGFMEPALAAAERLTRLTATLDDSAVALSAATGLARCFENMGNPWQAARVLAEAIAVHGHAEGGAGAALLTALNLQSLVCAGAARLLRPAQAEDERRQLLALGHDAARRALAMLQARPHPVYRVMAQCNLAELLLELGEAAPAHDLLTDAMASARVQNLPRVIALIRPLLAAALLALQRTQEAEQQVEEALGELSAAVPTQIAGRTYEIAHLVFKARGRWCEALACLEQAEARARAELIVSLRRQSSVLVLRSEADRARDEAAQADREARVQRERAEQLEQHAFTDPLTGLGNRRDLQRRMDEALAQLQESGGTMAVAQLDVDDFKRVNDRYGHAAGDAVLVGLARILRDRTRQHDIVARHGGEEFVLAFPGQALSQAAEVCERLRAGVGRTAIALPDGTSLNITVSIGLAATPPYDAAALIQRSDEALYRAKQNGRNRVECG